MNHRKNVMVSGGVFFLGLALAWAVYTPSGLGIKYRQPPQLKTDTTICPLSKKQQEESIQKFSEMVPVFTHPRCINCHGAVNPFAANTNHIGGRIGVKFATRTVMDNILGREVTVVEPDNQSLSNPCADCHSAAPSWFPPPPEKWFIGKDAIKLCEQVKDQANNQAESFIDHIEHDSLDLIPESFKGTRGLDENGQGIYEQETGKDFRPEPPPISHAQFIQQGQNWVTVTGGKFKGDYTCGCISHKYTLKGGAEIAWYYVPDTPFLTGHADVEIPIEFKDDGSFAGATTVDVNFTGNSDIGGTKCSWTMTDKGQVWKAKGNIDKGELNLTITVVSPVSDYTGQCSGFVNGTVTNHSAGGAWDLDPFSNFVEVGEGFPVKSETKGGYVKGQFSVIEEEQ